ncbi:MAG: glycosyltransferase family 4 protein [Phycisphaerales bacterium]|nr:glycosyltransferase family 4 protein [Phycisphaerales bacterium]
MRILIINQPYWPDVVATAQHLTDWTAMLVAQGHQVTVIASRSVYGKPGATLPRRETHNGVTILRTGASFFAKGRVLTRFVDWGLFNILALCKALTLPRQDVVVTLTTPPFLGAVGMLLKSFRGSRYIQYEMDLYPDVPIALGVMKPRSFAARLFDRMHRKLLRSADRIVVLGRCMQRVIQSKNIPMEKTALITPWADPAEIVPVPRDQNAFLRQHDLAGKFIVMYSGNLGLGHDISSLTHAMRTLNDSADPIDQSIHFVFIGGGRRMQELRTFLDTANLHNTLLLDYQPRESLSQTLSAADLHIITQHPRTSGLLVPSKFYGILAAGRPSFYIGPPDTEIALAINQYHLGQVFSTDDHDAFLTALRHCRNNPGDSAAFESHARQILTEHYSRQLCCEKLTALLATT